MSTQTLANIAASRRRMIDVLLNPAVHADVVLSNGSIVNVISGEIYKGDLAIAGEHIVKVGNCSDMVGPKTIRVDLRGAHVMPGLIDAHMHFESAMLTATEFVRLSLPTGTTSLVCDPHEIANVLGPKGVAELAKECLTLPVRIHTRVPCVLPDVPSVETCGVDISSKDIPELMEMPTVDGIGELQSISIPSFVYKNTPQVFDDVIKSTVYARSHGKMVDGNAAAIFGNDLAAHIIAGGTDISCHETTSKEETLEKLRYGVWVLMREGSTQRNMKECIRVITEDGLDARRLCLVTDDMLPVDLRQHGHMNDVIRRTIAAGIKPIMAIQMATINPATWMGLSDVGVLAPGKLADLCIVEGSLHQMKVSRVYVAGRLVAENGSLKIDLPRYRYPDWVKKTIKRGPVIAEELAIRCEGSSAVVRGVGLIPDQNLSKLVETQVPVVDGIVQSDVSKDMLQAAVVERHGRHGGVGKGFISGFGMKRGAIAETVSHNCHNIIVMGTNLADMVVAVNEVMKMQGGIVMVDGGKVIDSLRLPIAGLMSDEYEADDMTNKVAEMTKAAQEKLGVKVHSPFMHLAFLSLSTSPEWKLTDKGLLKVDTLEIFPPLRDPIPKVA
jgi:adenine deaminase